MDDFADLTFPVDAALGEGIRVKLNSDGELVAAGATDAAYIGWTKRETFAAGDLVAITSRGREVVVKAAAAITAYVALYSDASGAVNGSAPENSVLVGVALEAASSGARFRAMVW